MRTKNPEQRQVPIRWSSQSWAPRIVVVPEQGLDGPELCGERRDPENRIELFTGRLARRRQTTTTWKRDGLWLGPGTRPIWR
jgi:hypothetical protein